MKRIRKAALAAVMLSAVTFSAYTAGLPVIDIGAITQAIAGYIQQLKAFSDQVMATKATIDTYVMQAQEVVSSGQYLFSGQAADDAMAQLEAVRGLEDFASLLDRAERRLNQGIFDVNGNSYSLADFLGCGDRSYTDFFSDIKLQTSANLKNQAKKWAEVLTLPEQEYIKDKYGLLPEDYYLTQKTKEQTDAAMELVMAQANAVNQMEIQKQAAEYNLAVQNLLKNKNISTKQLQEALVKLSQANALQMQNLCDSMTSFVNYSMINELQQKQEQTGKAALEEQRKKDIEEDLNRSSIPYYWGKK